ncbi:hypothetical protein MD484_g8733, partial [Candolleomyces efflorescens]
MYAPLDPVEKLGLGTAAGSDGIKPQVKELTNEGLRIRNPCILCPRVTLRQKRDI